MAHSAAGGVGFGAGTSSTACCIASIFVKLIDCCVQVLRSVAGLYVRSFDYGVRNRGYERRCLLSFRFMNYALSRSGSHLALCNIYL